MANGTTTRRQDRAREFTPDQRIWLLEGDMDEVVARVDRRLQKIESRLTWVLATFVLMIISFAGALLALVGR